jgi:16S rRNA (cytosine967-C5)-methyltransferase
MHPRILRLVQAIIGNASRERPADRVLGQSLKNASGLTRAEGQEIAERVFAYFRWFHWVRGLDVGAATSKALELAERFRGDPGSFLPEELLARAIPDWTSTTMEVSMPWVQSLQASPTLWLRARRGKTADLCERLGDCITSRFPGLEETVLYAGRRDLFHASEFQSGDFEIQDISSQAVGYVCNPAPGEKWWDACTGEGGKLLHLADLMENKGLILGSDRSARRLQKVKLRTARAGVFNYRVKAWDGSPNLPEKTLFDGVLVDAPCSGIGTWQRNPHARWTTTPQDVEELAVVQRNLLDHAAGAVRPGGKLIYAVCTLSRRETVETAGGFERGQTAFEPLALRNPFAGDGQGGNQLWFLPEEIGGNGMFVAGWRRRGG